MVVKKYAGTSSDHIVVLNISASDFCSRHLEPAGFKGACSELIQSLETGGTVSIDQFAIELSQIS